LEKFFANNSKVKACSIRFEHPINGTKYSNEIYKAIALYELHLRYFVNAQKLVGTPYAYQTVGSSFAVRAEYYAQVNGMSAKKAGEDFYFLQKIIALGDFSELNSTCVFPSPRISNRVGFGTGPSVGEISKSGEKYTYNLLSFLEIKKLFSALPELYEEPSYIYQLDLDDAFVSYLQNQNTEQILKNLKRNNKTLAKFSQAFMHWFGGFEIFKVLNILGHKEAFRYVNVIDAVNQLNIVEESNDVFKLLESLRKVDTKLDF
jgi:hypothetical protein